MTFDCWLPSGDGVLEQSNSAVRRSRCCQVRHDLDAVAFLLASVEIAEGRPSWVQTWTQPTARKDIPMKIKLTTVYVNDQEKALRIYTEVLGFTKKADFSNGPFRWLTVVSTEEPTGTELQLALNDNPAAKAYQQAMFQQNQSAVMFYSDDVAADYERLKAKGADFVLPPTDVTASIIARLSDACGNLIQITQLKPWTA
jgi:predicted enzyme related to lactoylglutathione lyase